MSISPANLLIGFLLGLLARYCWDLRARYRAYVEAKKLQGTWTAFNMLNDRQIDFSKTMEHAGPTVIAAKPHWWSANSHVLSVSAEENSNGKVLHHDGYLVLDPFCPRLATRIVCYADSNEIAQQHIVLDANPDLLHVFPIALSPRGIRYDRHALRRLRT
jgi:hypothetical protein